MPNKRHNSRDTKYKSNVQNVTLLIMKGGKGMSNLISTLMNIDFGVVYYWVAKATPILLVSVLFLILFFVSLRYVIATARRKSFKKVDITHIVLVIFMPILMYMSVSQLTATTKEIINADTETQVVHVKKLSDLEAVTKNVTVVTNKADLVNSRSEWYLKEGYDYEVTYYKKSKVITNVGKINGIDYN